MDTHQPLADCDERQRRLDMIHEPRVKPLTVFVHRIRAAESPEQRVPYFDPLDGGIEAEALFLLEAPGPRAVDSGFVSRDNPDVTARNMRLMSLEAGIDRTRTVLWNIVPWYVGSKQKIRPAMVGDVKTAKPYLERLLPLLERLRVVALVGKKALMA